MVPLTKHLTLLAYSNFNDSRMVATCIPCSRRRQILAEAHNHYLYLIGHHYRIFGGPEQYVSKNLVISFTSIV